MLRNLLHFFSMALQPFGPWPVFSFLILYIVGMIPWTGDQPVAEPLPIHRTTQTQNKRIQISMPVIGTLSSLSNLNINKIIGNYLTKYDRIHYYIVFMFPRDETVT
jgi:hypothetical protein